MLWLALDLAIDLVSSGISSLFGPNPWDDFAAHLGPQISGFRNSIEEHMLWGHRRVSSVSLELSVTCLWDGGGSVL